MANEDIIAPLPRVTVQAFCETQGVADTISEAVADRRMSRAHVKVLMGGGVAAVEAFRQSPTPNILVIEGNSARDEVLQRLDELAERLWVDRIVHQRERVVAQTLVQACHKHRESKTVQLRRQENQVVDELWAGEPILLEQQRQLLDDDSANAHSVPSGSSGSNPLQARAVARSQRTITASL
jgi:precorrin-6B methylase 2